MRPTSSDRDHSRSSRFDQRLGRRSLVRRGGLVAGAAAALAAPRFAGAQEFTADEVTFDVALDGATVRHLKATPGDPSGLPMTGDTFILFGSIFPAGTFDSGDINPDQDGAIGRWICRGAFYVDLTTQDLPHAVTTVLHVLGDGLSSSVGGPIGQSHDAIIHEGFEGGLEQGTRAIVGGTGRYAGARGEVFQVARGANDTIFQITPEIAVPAPSYTFTFRFQK